MKISVDQLKRLVREEKARLNRRRVNEDLEDAVGVQVVAPEALVESEDAAEAVLVEMSVAVSHLDQVVESLEGAVELLEHCEDPVACHKPLVEALESQVEALQETLEAEVSVLKESVGDAELGDLG